MLLNTLLCMGQPLAIENYPAQNARSEETMKHSVLCTVQGQVGESHGKATPEAI